MQNSVALFLVNLIASTFKDAALQFDFTKSV